MGTAAPLFRGKLAENPHITVVPVFDPFGDDAPPLLVLKGGGRAVPAAASFAGMDRCIKQGMGGSDGVRVLWRRAFAAWPDERRRKWGLLPDARAIRISDNAPSRATLSAPGCRASTISMWSHSPPI